MVGLLFFYHLPPKNTLKDSSRVKVVHALSILTSINKYSSDQGNQPDTKHVYHFFDPLHCLFSSNPGSR
jgi:hypothetical protein